ncbi:MULTISPECIES: hypothetical protein [Halobacterium]|uniref:Uncharacterized protein n=4 Tax=Halobacterium salinarum TaxID=2242 RepID=Q9HMP8_HALSA|nr:MULTISPECIES: hypothetical protein [Halobacterium]AAG20523.1 hypothetical protein VNG_2442H [Halobacterium salinarum NRC-1]MBB6089546.1 hypothetical protein [Halobacterium salinarum]MCF2164295.1 hypothetical protein [Halobacterium salinarum]MCF2167082.1 hypothetical protein [Halobacterium salinarum]MCF2208215.1 hypothetical protein [Halobacterium salinarum]
MPVTRDADDDTEDRLTALQSSPERTVFTEDGNADGWLSTDLTVDVER